MIALLTLAHAVETLSTKSTETVSTTSTTATTSTTTSTEASTSAAVAAGDPAAVIVLAEAIDAVSRPGTVADLAGSLTTGFGEGTIPASFAVEVAPWWYTKGARSTDLRSYAEGTSAALHNLNVSFAVTNTADVGPRAALALRTTLYGAPRKGSALDRFLADHSALLASGQLPAGEVNACVRTLDFLAGFSDALNLKVAEAVRSELVGAVRDAQLASARYCATVQAGITPVAAARCASEGFATSPVPGPPPDPAVGESLDAATQAELTRVLTAQKEAETKAASLVGTKVAEQLQAIAKDPAVLGATYGAYAKEKGLDQALGGCATLLSRREGFVVDVAGGASVEAPASTLASVEGGQITAWVAPGYVWQRATVYGMARWAVEAPGSAPLHVGLFGLGWGHEWDRLALALAGVVRVPFDGATPTSRVSIGTDVRAFDGVWFSTGLQLGFPGDDPGTFVTLAGIKLGATKERTLTPSIQDLQALVPT